MHTVMKGLLLLSVVVLYSEDAKAQFIQQLRLNPVQPVDNMPVQVIADLFFPNSGCPLDGITITQTGPYRFEADALHCLGLLTTICSTSDTFDLGVLPAGSYRFVLQEQYGWFPSPCSPGTQPPAIDSIDFQVTVASGLSESAHREVVLYPNPASDGVFTVRIDESSVSGVFRILDLDGRILRILPADSQSRQIDLSDCAEGLYLIELWQGLTCTSRTRLIKH